MILQFHVPRSVGEKLLAKGRKVILTDGSGIIEIDSVTVTNAELTEISMDRATLDAILDDQPRDLEAEIDDLKVKVEKLEKK